MEKSKMDSLKQNQELILAIALSQKITGCDQPKDASLQAFLYFFTSKNEKKKIIPAVTINKFNTLLWKFAKTALPDVNLKEQEVIFQIILYYLSNFPTLVKYNEQWPLLAQSVRQIINYMSSILSILEIQIKAVQNDKDKLDLIDNIFNLILLILSICLLQKNNDHLHPSIDNIKNMLKENMYLQSIAFDQNDEAESDPKFVGGLECGKITEEGNSSELKYYQNNIFYLTNFTQNFFIQNFQACLAEVQRFHAQYEAFIFAAIKQTGNLEKPNFAQAYLQLFFDLSNSNPQLKFFTELINNSIQKLIPALLKQLNQKNINTLITIFQAKDGIYTPEIRLHYIMLLMEVLPQHSQLPKELVQQHLLTLLKIVSEQSSKIIGSITDNNVFSCAAFKNFSTKIIHLLEFVYNASKTRKDGSIQQQQQPPLQQQQQAITNQKSSKAPVQPVSKDQIDEEQQQQCLQPLIAPQQQQQLQPQQQQQQPPPNLEMKDQQIQQINSQINQFRSIIAESENFSDYEDEDIYKQSNFLEQSDSESDNSLREPEQEMDYNSEMNQTITNKHMMSDHYMPPYSPDPFLKQINKIEEELIDPFNMIINKNKESASGQGSVRDQIQQEGGALNNNSVVSADQQLHSDMQDCARLYGFLLDFVSAICSNKKIRQLIEMKFSANSVECYIKFIEEICVSCKNQTLPVDSVLSNTLQNKICQIVFNLMCGVRRLDINQVVETSQFLRKYVFCSTSRLRSNYSVSICLQMAIILAHCQYTNKASPEKQSQDQEQVNQEINKEIKNFIQFSSNFFIQKTVPQLQSSLIQDQQKSPSQMTSQEMQATTTAVVITNYQFLIYNVFIQYFEDDVQGNLLAFFLNQGVAIVNDVQALNASNSSTLMITLLLIIKLIPELNKNMITKKIKDLTLNYLQLQFDAVTSTSSMVEDFNSVYFYEQSSKFKKQSFGFSKSSLLPLSNIFSFAEASKGSIGSGGIVGQPINMQQLISLILCFSQKLNENSKKIQDKLTSQPLYISIELDFNLLAIKLDCKFPRSEKIQLLEKVSIIQQCIKIEHAYETFLSFSANNNNKSVYSQQQLPPALMEQENITLFLAILFKINYFYNNNKSQGGEKRTGSGNGSTSIFNQFQQQLTQPQQQQQNEGAAELNLPPPQAFQPAPLTQEMSIEQDKESLIKMAQILEIIVKKIVACQDTVNSYEQQILQTVFPEQDKEALRLQIWAAIRFLSISKVKASEKMVQKLGYLPKQSQAILEYLLNLNHLVSASQSCVLNVIENLRQNYFGSFFIDLISLVQNPLASFSPSMHQTLQGSSCPGLQFALDQLILHKIILKEMTVMLNSLFDQFKSNSKEYKGFASKLKPKILEELFPIYLSNLNQIEIGDINAVICLHHKQQQQPLVLIKKEGTGQVQQIQSNSQVVSGNNNNNSTQPEASNVSANLNVNVPTTSSADKNTLLQLIFSRYFVNQKLIMNNELLSQMQFMSKYSYFLDITASPANFEPSVDTPFRKSLISKLIKLTLRAIQQNPLELQSFMIALLWPAVKDNVECFFKNQQYQKFVEKTFKFQTHFDNKVCQFVQGPSFSKLTAVQQASLKVLHSQVSGSPDILFNLLFFFTKVADLQTPLQDFGDTLQQQSPLKSPQQSPGTNQTLFYLNMQKLKNNQGNVINYLSNKCWLPLVQLISFLLIQQNASKQGQDSEGLQVPESASKNNANEKEKEQDKSSRKRRKNQQKWQAPIIQATRSKISQGVPPLPGGKAQTSSSNQKKEQSGGNFQKLAAIVEDGSSATYSAIIQLLKKAFTLQFLSSLAAIQVEDIVYFIVSQAMEHFENKAYIELNKKAVQDIFTMPFNQIMSFLSRLTQINSENLNQQELAQKKGQDVLQQAAVTSNTIAKTQLQQQGQTSPTKQQINDKLARVCISTIACIVNSKQLRLDDPLFPIWINTRPTQIVRLLHQIYIYMQEAMNYQTIKLESQQLMSFLCQFCGKLRVVCKEATQQQQTEIAEQAKLQQVEFLQSLIQVIKLMESHQTSINQTQNAMCVENNDNANTFTNVLQKEEEEKVKQLFAKCYSALPKDIEVKECFFDQGFDAHYYHCYTCQAQSVCTSCVYHCHIGHDIAYEQKTRALCNCAKLLQTGCRLRRGIEKKGQGTLDYPAQIQRTDQLFNDFRQLKESTMQQHSSTSFLNIYRQDLEASDRERELQIHQRLLKFQPGRRPQEFSYFADREQLLLSNSDKYFDELDEEEEIDIEEEKSHYDQRLEKIGQDDNEDNENDDEDDDDDDDDDDKLQHQRSPSYKPQLQQKLMSPLMKKIQQDEIRSIYQNEEPLFNGVIPQDGFNGSDAFQIINIPNLGVISPSKIIAPGNQIPQTRVRNKSIDSANSVNNNNDGESPQNFQDMEDEKSLESSLDQQNSQSQLIMLPQQPLLRQQSHNQMQPQQQRQQQQSQGQFSIQTFNTPQQQLQQQQQQQQQFKRAENEILSTILQQSQSSSLQMENSVCNDNSDFLDMALDLAEDQLKEQTQMLLSMTSMEEEVKPTSPLQPVFDFGGNLPTAIPCELMLDGQLGSFMSKVLRIGKLDVRLKEDYGQEHSIYGFMNSFEQQVFYPKVIRSPIDYNGQRFVAVSTSNRILILDKDKIINASYRDLGGLSPRMHSYTNMEEAQIERFQTQFFITYVSFNPKNPLLLACVGLNQICFIQFNIDGKIAAHIEPGIKLVSDNINKFQWLPNSDKYYAIQCSKSIKVQLFTFESVMSYQVLMLNTDQLGIISDFCIYEKSSDQVWAQPFYNLSNSNSANTNTSASNNNNNSGCNEFKVFLACGDGNVYCQIINLNIRAHKNYPVKDQILIPIEYRIKSHVCIALQYIPQSQLMILSFKNGINLIGKLDESRRLTNIHRVKPSAAQNFKDSQFQIIERHGDIITNLHMLQMSEQSLLLACHLKTGSANNQHSIHEGLLTLIKLTKGKIHIQPLISSSVFFNQPDYLFILHFQIKDERKCHGFASIKIDDKASFLLSVQEDGSLSLFVAANESNILKTYLQSNPLHEQAQRKQFQSNSLPSSGQPNSVEDPQSQTFEKSELETLKNYVKLCYFPEKTIYFLDFKEKYIQGKGEADLSLLKGNENVNNLLHKSPNASSMVYDTSIVTAGNKNFIITGIRVQIEMGANTTNQTFQARVFNRTIKINNNGQNNANVKRFVDFALSQLEILYGYLNELCFSLHTSNQQSHPIRVINIEVYVATTQQFDLRRKITWLQQLLRIEPIFQTQQELELKQQSQLQKYFTNTSEVLQVDLIKRQKCISDTIKEPRIVNLVNALDILAFAFQNNMPQQLMSTSSYANQSTLIAAGSYLLPKIDLVVQKIRQLLAMEQHHQITLNSLKRCAKKALHCYQLLTGIMNQNLQVEQVQGNSFVAGHPYEYTTLKTMARVKDMASRLQRNKVNNLQQLFFFLQKLKSCKQKRLHYLYYIFSSHPRLLLLIARTLFRILSDQQQPESNYYTIEQSLFMILELGIVHYQFLKNASFQLFLNKQTKISDELNKDNYIINTLKECFEGQDSSGTGNFNPGENQLKDVDTYYGQPSVAVECAFILFDVVLNEIQKMDYKMKTRKIIKRLLLFVKFEYIRFLIEKKESKYQSFEFSYDIYSDFNATAQTKKDNSKIEVENSNVGTITNNQQTRGLQQPTSHQRFMQDKNNNNNNKNYSQQKDIIMDPANMFSQHNVEEYDEEMMMKIAIEISLNEQKSNQQANINNKAPADKTSQDIQAQQGDKTSFVGLTQFNNNNSISNPKQQMEQENQDLIFSNDSDEEQKKPEQIEDLCDIITYKLQKPKQKSPQYSQQQQQQASLSPKQPNSLTIAPTNIQQSHPSLFKLQVFSFDLTKDLLRKICKQFSDRQFANNQANQDILTTNFMLLFNILRFQSTICQREKNLFDNDYPKIIWETLINLLEQVPIQQYNEEGKVLMMFLYLITEMMQVKQMEQQQRPGSVSNSTQAMQTIIEEQQTMKKKHQANSQNQLTNQQTTTQKNNISLTLYQERQLEQIKIWESKNNILLTTKIYDILEQLLKHFQSGKSSLKFENIHDNNGSNSSGNSVGGNSMAQCFVDNNPNFGGSSYQPFASAAVNNLQANSWIAYSMNPRQGIYHTQQQYQQQQLLQQQQQQQQLAMNSQAKLMNQKYQKDKPGFYLQCAFQHPEKFGARLQMIQSQADQVIFAHLLKLILYLAQLAPNMLCDIHNQKYCELMCLTLLNPQTSSVNPIKKMAKKLAELMTGSHHKYLQVMDNMIFKVEFDTILKVCGNQNNLKNLSYDQLREISNSLQNLLQNAKKRPANWVAFCNNNQNGNGSIGLSQSSSSQSSPLQQGIIEILHLIVLNNVRECVEQALKLITLYYEDFTEVGEGIGDYEENNDGLGNEAVGAKFQSLADVRNCQKEFEQLHPKVQKKALKRILSQLVFQLTNDQQNLADIVINLINNYKVSELVKLSLQEFKSRCLMIQKTLKYPPIIDDV